MGCVNDAEQICYNKQEQLNIIETLKMCEVNRRVMDQCVNEKQEYPYRHVIWGGVIGMAIGAVAVGFIK